MRTAVLIAAALGALGALAACASPTGADAVKRFDSFEAQGPADFSRYDAVYIAPVTASDEIRARIDYRPLGTQDRVRPLSEEDIEGQTDDLSESLAAEIGKVARLVDAPGPDVLTIEAVITELDANRPTMAEFRANAGLSFDSISVGDAGVEVTLKEGDAVLAVIEDGALMRAINDPGVGVGIWSTSRRYYDRLADKLAALLV